MKYFRRNITLSDSLKVKRSATISVSSKHWHSDCICSTCLSIFPEASSGRAPYGGRCVPIWVDRIFPSFLRPRLLHLEEATPGQPESSSIVSRWLLDAWEICEQLFRRGLPAPRSTVWRHVTFLLVAYLVKRGERKHRRWRRERGRKGEMYCMRRAHAN